MRTTVCTLLVLVLLPAGGSAQTPLTPEQTLPPTPVFPTQEEFDEGASITWFSGAVRLVGGAIAGAWVGFMASQVAVSDWDDVAIERGSWAGAGAAVGMALSWSLPVGGPPGQRRSAPSPDRDILTLREIREARVDNVYELIRAERPEWLRTRGTASMRETPRGHSTGDGPGEYVITDPGIETIRVYLEDAYLGGVETLRSYSPGQVGEIRRLDRAEATQRWGAGHLHGAIQLIIAPPTSTLSGS